MIGLLTLLNRPFTEYIKHRLAIDQSTCYPSQPMAIPPISDGNFAKTGYLYRNQNPIYKHLSQKENINLF